jgi:hypothetical protein
VGRRRGHGAELADLTMCAAALAANLGMYAQVRAISSQRGWFRYE